jgi:hypothetical protein
VDFSIPKAVDIPEMEKQNAEADAPAYLFLAPQEGLEPPT